MRQPAVYTIPPGISFVDSLASGLMARTADDPGALSQYRILLPTRRACRALADAFLRRSEGRALILPDMTPIGDIDETEMAFTGEDMGAAPGALDIPPAIPELRRRLLLSELILRQRGASGQDGGRGGGQGGERDGSGGGITADQAARLAEELARFLDQVQTERLSFDGLAELAPAEHAEHWQVTLEFLKIVTEHWPAILEQEGCIDPAERRNRLIDARIAQWKRSPPTTPVIIAGSTGSVPATADLMAAAVDLPEGAIVLPGLDLGLDPEAAQAVDVTHPQYGMRRILDRLRLRPEDVSEWEGMSPDRGSARADLLRAVMRPAAAAPPHMAGGPDADTVRRAAEGVSRIDCATPHEEAVVIAMALREVLETPGKTAALITPDRSLARRVAAELPRWGIDIDDSAGVALDDTPIGAFLRLTAELIAEAAAPIPLLACLKHPLAAGGMAPGAFRAKARALEIAVLRGPRPAPGFDGIREALPQGADHKDLVSWVQSLADMAAPLQDIMHARRAPLADVLAAHAAFAEALARTDSEPGADRLWRGDAGESAALFVRELHAAASALGAVDGGAYPALLEALMRGRVVRPRHGRHPRLNIWGPLEARLQQADLLILGGLNEGAWPPETNADPWMSRPMRHRFGLPSPERRVGLSAHDFAQAFAAPSVMLTRATRVDGTPTVPSRWLQRLDNVLEALKLKGLLDGDAPGRLAWQAGLDRPALMEQIRTPHACPPVSARPRRLSVTRIEMLIRDPYSIYASHVLRLRPLEPIDADPAAADRGTIIHAALEAFLARFPDDLPAHAFDAMLEVGREAFGATLEKPGVRAFWWPRFVRAAQWFVDRERERRTRLSAIHSEVTGTMEIDAPAGPFTLTAKADRIDVGRDGTVEIIDYKTGAPPSKTQIEAGYAPQLPLEAMIAAAGGFPGLASAPPDRLAIWQLSGGDPPAKTVELGGDIAALVDSVWEGLIDLISCYDDPETPYLPAPDPHIAPLRSDYDHLARVKEWSSTDNGSDGGGAS